MTTFAEDKASAWHDRPIEYYDVVCSTGEVFQLASGNRDLQVGSKIYKATPVERSELVSPNVDGSSKDVELSIPVDHAIVSRWTQIGGPPQQTAVTAWQKQERSGLSEQQWVGLVTEIVCDGNIAKLSIPARVANNVGRYLPTVTTSLGCPYILYDEMCTVDRESFKVAAAVIAVNGRDVTVNMGDFAKIGLNPGWAALGMLIHIPTNAPITILAQTDIDPAHSTLAVLTMQRPLAAMKVGDGLAVYAGCDHTPTTCDVKFNVIHRYGGTPYAPAVNPFVPGGSGIKADT
jgi:hypothetical protein